MRTARSSGRTKILPSPTSPVRAPSQSASIVGCDERVGDGDLEADLLGEPHLHGRAAIGLDAVELTAVALDPAHRDTRAPRRGRGPPARRSPSRPRPEKANDVLEALYRAEVRGRLDEPGPGPRRRARPGRDLSRDDREDGARRQGSLRDRGLRRRSSSRRSTRSATARGPARSATARSSSSRSSARSGSAPARPTTAPSPRWANDASRSCAGRQGRHRRHRLDAGRDRARADDDPGARALLRRAWCARRTPSTRS